MQLLTQLYLTYKLFAVLSAIVLLTLTRRLNSACAIVQAPPITGGGGKEGEREVGLDLTCTIVDGGLIDAFIFW